MARWLEEIEARCIQDDLDAMLEDDLVAGPLDYHLWVDGQPVVDRDTGRARDPRTTCPNLRAYVGKWAAKSEHDDEFVLAKAGTKAILRLADLPGPPGTKDEFTHNGVRHQVIEVNRTRYAALRMVSVLGEAAGATGGG